MSEIIQFTVSLKGSKPMIWRTFFVNRETSFFELHHILQIVMGWTNSHLFEFNLDGYRVGMVDEKEVQFGNGQVLDSRTTLLTDILSLERDYFQYKYDFGDGWVHQITLDKLVKKDNKTLYPRCFGGEMNCPPEDCGGIKGFYGLLNILQDKKNPGYKEMKLWLGKKYNPENYDLVKVNKQLKELKNYISKWNSPE